MLLYLLPMSKEKYVFKAQWRATAVTFWVEARNEVEAQKKAECAVTRMQGGSACMSLELLGIKD
jgi:hypothetical protein